tara:strand:- start:559 stop:2412 length:1854 start_codon:yes stop_codon:yes gene_type:complete
MKLPEFVVSLIAFFVTIYVPALSFFVSGPSAYFQFFAADTFYYLTIAANTSWSTIASFDGISPTNGFHPLWQFLLKTIFASFGHITQPTQISITFWLSLFFVGMSASIVAYVLKKTELVQSTGLILLALTPGFLYFIVALPNPNYGHLWSYANGMESSLSLFFFSMLFLLVLSLNNSFEKLNALNCLFVGLLIGLIILTRLDDLFILPGLIVVGLISKQAIQNKFKWCIYVGIVPTVLICFYMLLNYEYAGSALPTSGQAKGGLSLLGNAALLVNGLVPLKTINANGWNYWNETTWRALHNVVPLCVAIIFLVFYFRNYKEAAGRYLTQYDSFLAGLAIYVILKGLYNFLFVAIWYQGHWYYPISILVTNVLIARGLSAFIEIKNIGNGNLILSSRSLAIVLGILCIICGFSLFFMYLAFAPLNGLALTAVMITTMIGLVSLSGLYFTKMMGLGIRVPYILIIFVLIVPLVGNSFLSTKETTSYNRKYEILFNNRQDLKAALENSHPDFKLLSFDDGIIAYSLQFPTMSGLGFALDKEAHTAKEEGNLLELAYSRGYKWLTSLNYMPSFEARVGDDVTLQLKEAFWLNSTETKQYKFRLVYIHPITKLKIISFEPKI